MELIEPTLYKPSFLKNYINGEHYMAKIYYICVPKFILRNETIKNHKINHQQGERVS